MDANISQSKITCDLLYLMPSICLHAFFEFAIVNVCIIFTLSGWDELLDKKRAGFYECPNIVFMNIVFVIGHWKKDMKMKYFMMLNL